MWTAAPREEISGICCSTLCAHHSTNRSLIFLNLARNGDLSRGTHRARVPQGAVSTREARPRVANSPHTPQRLDSMAIFCSCLILWPRDTEGGDPHLFLGLMRVATVVVAGIATNRPLRTAPAATARATRPRIAIDIVLWWWQLSSAPISTPQRFRLDQGDAAVCLAGDRDGERLDS